MCATASGQRRREPGQCREAPEGNICKRKCPGAVGGDGKSTARIRVREWRGQRGQTPTTARHNKSRNVIAVVNRGADAAQAGWYKAKDGQHEP